MLHKGREKPLIGIAVLVIAAILMDCASEIHEALFEPPAVSRQPRDGCFYRIVEDDVVLAHAFAAQPEILSEILATAGMPHRFAWADGSQRMPCDRSLKFDHGSRQLSAEKIPGALLLAALRRIDINDAEEGDLLAVPGIGPRTAENIVRLRERCGGFSCLEDLRRVPGLGRRKLATLEPYIEVKAPEVIQASRQGEMR
jgi:competence ComEA-like helix-hairpin-helix protein